MKTRPKIIFNEGAKPFIFEALNITINEDGSLMKDNKQLLSNGIIATKDNFIGIKGDKIFINTIDLLLSI